ncbi:MAG: ABC transporter substrate-binding protein [Planctomycetes bacterium]|nr:ABC transporter substrate-binding protein [Planctomycetota bacterium]
MSRALLPLLLLSSACRQEAPAPQADAFYECESPDGARVILQERPARVIPTSSSTTDIVLALIEPERLAGLPETVLSYSHEVSQRGMPAEVPTFTHYVGESLLALSPDLVIGHVYQELDTTRVLRKAGVPVYSLTYPKTVEAVISDVRQISELLGETERGEALAREMQTRLERLRADTRREELRALTYTNLGSGVWTTGAGSSLDLMIQLAGMQNAGAEDGYEMDYQIDVERLLVLDPDVLIVAGSVSGLTPSIEFLREDELIQGLKAVRHDHIVTLPSTLFSANSQHLLTAAEHLSASVDALPDIHK